MITSTSFVSTIFLVPLRLFFRFFLVIISLAHIITISSPSEPWKKKMNMFVTAFILEYTETNFVIVAANRVASTWLKSKRKKKKECR
jgi:antibiotic biosynthesis monooxygenase (ABM) superfamily enzyme